MTETSWPGGPPPRIEPGQEARPGAAASGDPASEAGFTPAQGERFGQAPETRFSEQSRVRTCLWFHAGGEVAAEFYVSLLPDSAVERTFRPDPDGPALVVDFRLGGAPYQILNGGPHYTLTPAVSISVLTDDQAETDRLWAALLAEGGAESMCGWLVDRFGVSWQIVPRMLPRLLTSPDAAAAARVREALFQMRKLDHAALEAAFRG